MRHTELRRLRALRADLDACRETLRRTSDEYDEARRRRHARRVRLAATAALCALFIAGLGAAGTPSFGASGRAGASVPCGPGTSSIDGAKLSVKGDTATATFTIKAGCSGTTVSFSSYEMLSGPNQLYPQTRYDYVTQTLDAGPQSLTVHLPSCYWQIDLATGDSLPAINAGSLYRERLAVALHGGNADCPPATTTTTTTTGTTSTTTTTTTTTGTTTTGTTTTGTTTTGTTATTTTTTTNTTTTTAATTTAATAATTAAATTVATTPPPPVAVPTVADVAVTKVPDRTTAGVGEQVTYTITVVNNGPAAALDVVLVDPLPAQETFVSVSDPACTGGAVVTCSLGTLAAGASRVVTVVTLAHSPGTATNVATVNTSSPESTTTNNRSETTVTINGPFTPPAVCARLSLSHTRIVAGQSTQLTVQARGGSAAVSGARVEVRGPGVRVVRKTDAHGRARIVVTPHRVGVLRVRLLQAPSCRATLRELSVPGEFRPPQLTG